MRSFEGSTLAVWLALATPVTFAVAFPSRAEAAVAIAHTLDELVVYSPRVIVGRSRERQSRWEHVAGSKRIVTYTKVVVVENVVGGGESQVWVRTLGGAVGNIGQHVSGEASLAIGDKAVLFLTRATDGAWVVTGMAQGHFPVRAPAAKPADPPPPERLAASPTRATLLPSKGPANSAHSRLVGKTLGESLAAIRTVKAEIDAREKK